MSKLIRLSEVRLRIVVVAPPPGVDFGIQVGKGSDFETVQKQRSKTTDLVFEVVVPIKDDDGVAPNFVGPMAQGPAATRFIYIDIGRIAGQTDTAIERRIKVPFDGITREMVKKTSSDSALVLEARLPGTGRDGGPSCGTVHPIEGWKCRRQ